MTLHPVVARVTARIRERSAAARGEYLRRIEAAAARERGAERMGCANVAHAFAALPGQDKFRVVAERVPRANGMPDLHKLTPPLAVLQGRGFRVALLTDGRMSGASGKVPAAIHVSPEASAGGPLAKLRDGDIVRLDAEAGVLQALVPEAEWAAREAATMPQALRQADGHGTGRELFASFRRNALSAEEGACTWL